MSDDREPEGTGERRAAASRLAEILTTRDVACLRCGYNLRGLDERGRCPECGTPVGRSVATPLLERVSRRWVARTARGTVLVSAALMVWIATAVLLALGVGVLLLTVNFGRFAGWRTPAIVASVVGGVGAGMGLVLVVVGALMASRREPELEQVASVRSWRRGVHLALGILLVAGPVGSVVLVGLRGSALAWRTYSLLVDTWLLVLAFGSVVVLAVFVGYLRQILVRVPDAGLGRRCAFRVRWLIASVLVFLLGFEMANTVLIPLGVEAQVAGWLVAIAGAGGALGASAMLAVAIAACGRRFAACGRPDGHNAL